MGCSNVPNELDDKMLEESARGANCSPDPQVLDKTGETKVEIEKRTEELGRQRVENRIEEIPKDELQKQPTSERVEKVLRDEFDAAPKQTRGEIYGYKYIDEERDNIAGKTSRDKIASKAHIEVYKGKDLLETVETATHERWEVSYDKLTPEQSKELKGLYLEAIYGVEGKEPVTNYAWQDERQFFCDSMATFKWEPGTLKEKDGDIFNFCREIYVSNEVERIKEQLVEGGFISPHSFFK